MRRIAALFVCCSVVYKLLTPNSLSHLNLLHVFPYSLARSLAMALSGNTLRHSAICIRKNLGFYVFVRGEVGLYGADTISNDFYARP